MGYLGACVEVKIPIHVRGQRHLLLDEETAYISSTGIEPRFRWGNPDPDTVWIATPTFHGPLDTTTIPKTFDERPGENVGSWKPKNADIG